MGLLALHILALVLFATTVWRRHIPRHYHCPRQHLKFLDFITKLVEDLKDGVGVKHIRIEDMPDDVVSPDDTILILFRRPDWHYVCTLVTLPVLQLVLLHAALSTVA
ncbi:hypothetical protein BASA83_001140 [Batrachochytrium salamandrivorans]|nr:hypothetical protein BASA83_001140 [Batrachochytrium salamandrivorans]